jgi:TANFOR domain-containing protein
MNLKMNSDMITDYVNTGCHLTKRLIQFSMTCLIAACSGLIMIPGPVSAQNEVMVSVAVLPPYSPYISDYMIYENRCVLSLTNTTPNALQIKLGASFTGDNGIRISTKEGFIPPTPLLLPPGMHSFTGRDLQPYLNEGNVQLQGITKEELIRKQGLPEGNYLLCIQALTYSQTGQSIPLSQPEPSGCSNLFTISYLEPPVIISPQNKGTLAFQPVQNYIFSWLTPAGALPGTNYTLRIVEVIPRDRNPDDAIKSATTPVFYEHTTASTSMIYGPSAPVLEPGKKYAMMVTATDLLSQVTYRNNGQSEVVSFDCQETVVPETPSVCECICSPSISKIAAPGGKMGFKVTGKFACAGSYGVGRSKYACAVASVAYEWNISAGSNIASIPGVAGKDSVNVNVTGTGEFVINVKVTVTCNDGTTCICYTNAEVPVEPPPTTSGCNCTIAHEWLGGPGIKILKNITAHTAPDKEQGLTLGMSALADDVDILVQQCILDGTREKFIKDVGDPVDYAWSVVSGDAANLIGDKSSTALYVLPYNIKPDETKTYKFKLVISSTHDDPIEGSVTFKVTGTDTCDNYKVTTEIEPLAPKGPKERPPVTKGQCFPADEEWISNGPIDGALTLPANVQVSQITILTASAKDPDELKIFCTSEKCGNPNEKISLSEPLVYTWSDGGAGGSFPIGVLGSSVLYLAPAEPKEITITCEIKDHGTHRAASGETKKLEGKITARDALTEMNWSGPSRYSKYFTVGETQKIVPEWITSPGITVLRAEYCTDIGGPSGHIEATRENIKGLSKSDASLIFENDKGRKDKDLTVHWVNHSHIHDVYKLGGRITFRFADGKIIYQDRAWKKSNFMKGEATSDFKLFFDKEKDIDDGKWRSDKLNDFDKTGDKNALNRTNPDNWMLHWAKNTYDPCAEGYDLTSKDPEFKYYQSIGSATADFYNGKHNIIRITPKAAEETDNPGFSGTAKLISSDRKKIEVVIALPPYKVEGIKKMNKVVNHELAHWESILKYWRAGEPWQVAYGEYLIKPKQISTFRAVSSKTVTSTSVEVTVAGDVVKKYSLAVTVTDKNGTVEKL